jgi:hypothetical protein
MGVAKIAVFAYERATGIPVWQSGTDAVASRARDLWVFGTGPFQRGSIYGGTKFAGEDLRVPLISSRDDDKRPPLRVSRERTFNPQVLSRLSAAQPAAGAAEDEGQPAAAKDEGRSTKDEVAVAGAAKDEGRSAKDEGSSGATAGLANSAARQNYASQAAFQQGEASATIQNVRPDTTPRSQFDSVWSLPPVAAEGEGRRTKYEVQGTKDEATPGSMAGSSNGGSVPAAATADRRWPGTVRTQ